ncbi:MAG TPA: glycosyltransferase family 2 protein [Leptolyngbyaceae cyanobacterium M65_K2018_010]|nr:glycosyltransferase family 2 protein [Leptolyngbyaceae cyanobacterium M65_K2018_010]
MAWLNRGHDLVLIQLALLVVAVIGLGVINGETAVVFYQHWRPSAAHQRGWLQRWLPWLASPRLPAPPRPQGGMSRSTDLGVTAQGPFVSVVVVAYLPNEQEIIEETLLHWLTQVEVPMAGWELILAYNTPSPLPVEARLRQLARQHPALVLLPVAQSRSKAANLNAALSQVKGEMTCIFDADHHPSPDCLRRAWEWLAPGHYDGVQGRNIIRNAGDNWLTHLVAVEFESIYGVSHYGRSLLADTALFGGSNGYWRTAAIRDLGFYPNRLTEDIDATVRGILRGYRLVHDPAIVTTELAPTSLRGLWLQRQRWSQGWLEVAWIYMDRVGRSPHLDPVQKTYWLLMLLFSQCFYPLVWQVVPMLLSIHFSISNRDLNFENLNMVMMGLLTLSVILQVALAMRLRPTHSAYSRRHGVLYCALSPVYFWFKVLVGMVALYNHLCGSRVWHVTARTQSPPADLGLGLTASPKPCSVKSR